MTSRAARATRWVRWLAVPWRSAVLLAALVVATAVPSLLTVVAAAWQSGAEDSIAAQVAGEADLRRSGVDIRLEVVFRSAEIERADTLLDEEQARSRLDSPTYLGALTQTGRIALVDPARLAWGLRRAVERMGGVIYEHTRVTQIDADQLRVRVGSEHGAIHAQRVIVATNAWAEPLRQMRGFGSIRGIGFGRRKP